jgi:hypothetical protein
MLAYSYVKVTDGTNVSDIPLGGSDNAGIDLTFSADNFLNTSGTITIKDGGVSNAELANDGIVFSHDGGSLAEVTLGSAGLTIAGGTGITTSGSGSTVTIARDAMATSDLTDVTAAASEEGQMLVANGSDNYVPRQVFHTYTGASATTHTITHGLGVRFCNVTVYETSTGEVVIPQSITANSTTETVVVFNSAVACTVVLSAVIGAETSTTLV